MRPRIICHMISSIDGKLHPSRYSKPAKASSELLGGHYDKTADTFCAGGWIVGRVTMAEIIGEGGPPSLAEGAVGERRTWVSPERGPSLAVAIDPQGRLRYERASASGDHLVAVLGEHVSDDYLADLRATGVSYVFAGADGRDLIAAMTAIREAFGVETLLLEGGGAINAAFLSAGLIDELSLLIYPGVDGVAGVQTIFDGPQGDQPGYGQSLAFKSVQVLTGDMLWLRYGVAASSLAA
jgi:5-amino-6-(5-phosphoribosylamino)uracil reductase